MAGRLRIVGVFHLPHLRERLGPPEVNHPGVGGHGTTSAFSGGERPAPGAWPEGAALQAAWPGAPLSTHPSRPYTDPTSALPFALPSTSRLLGLPSWLFRRSLRAELGLWHPCGWWGTRGLQAS